MWTVIGIVAWLFTLVAALLFGVIKADFFKKWALKMAGFDDAVADFFVAFVKAFSDFKLSKEEKENLSDLAEKIKDSLAPPPFDEVETTQKE